MQLSGEARRILNAMKICAHLRYLRIELLFKDKSARLAKVGAGGTGS